MKITPAGVLGVMDSAAEQAVTDERERITDLVRIVFGYSDDAEQLLRWIDDGAEVVDGTVVS